MITDCLIAHYTCPICGKSGVVIRHPEVTEVRCPCGELAEPTLYGDDDEREIPRPTSA